MEGSALDPPLEGRTCTGGEGRVQVDYATREALRADFDRALRDLRIDVDVDTDLGPGDSCNLVLQLPVVGRVLLRTEIKLTEPAGARLVILEPDVLGRAVQRALQRRSTIIGAPTLPPSGGARRLVAAAPAEPAPEPTKAPPPPEPAVTRAVMRPSTAREIALSRSVPPQAATAVDGFVRALIRSSLRARADGREADGRALTDALRDVTHGSGELLLSREPAWELACAGVTSFRVLLSDTLRGPDTAQLTQRLVEALERSEVTSVQIDATASREDLVTFAELLGRPMPSTVGSEERARRMARSLHEKRVMGVAVAFSETSVGREGQLPWRVRMLIERLRKDLRSIPIMRDADAAQLVEARIQTVTDAMRAIGDADTYTLVLEQADLIEAAKTEELRGQSLTRVIASLVPERFVAEVVGQLSLSVASSESARRALTELCIHLLEGQSPEAPAALAKLREHVDPQTIPGELGEWLAAERINDRLRRKESIPAVPAGGGRDTEAALGVRGKAVRLLVAACRLREAARLLEDTLLDAPTAQSLYDRLLEQIFLPEVLSQLALRLVEATERDAAGALLRYAGGRAIAPLLACVRQSEHRAVRELALRLLVEQGDAAYMPILHSLGERDAPWYVTRNMLVLATTLGIREAASDARRNLAHDHPRVREAALSFLVRITGQEAEPALLDALADEAQAVRIRAAANLAVFGSTDPRALAGYLEFLASAEARKSEAHAFAALRLYSGLSESERRTAGDLDRTLSERVIAWVQPGEPLPTDRVLLALAEVLGLSGSRRALHALRAVLPDLVERAATLQSLAPVVTAVSHAIEHIELREGHQTVTGARSVPKALVEARPLSSRILDERVGRAVVRLGSPTAVHKALAPTRPAPAQDGPLPEQTPLARRIQPPPRAAEAAEPSRTIELSAADLDLVMDEPPDDLDELEVRSIAEPPPLAPPPDDDEQEFGGEATQPEARPPIAEPPTRAVARVQSRSIERAAGPGLVERLRPGGPLPKPSQVSTLAEVQALGQGGGKLRPSEVATAKLRPSEIATAKLRPSEVATMPEARALGADDAGETGMTPDALSQLLGRDPKRQ